MAFQGLRIGLIGPVAPPAGGMAGQTRQLGELLAAEQAHVTLVATNSAYRPAWLGRLRGLRALCRLAVFVVTLWRVARSCDLFHLMANSGWSWHLFAAPAIVVAWLRKVPVVVNYRGGGAADFLRHSRWTVQLSMRLSSRLIVPSGFLRAVFAACGMPAEVVPNIVDLGRFQRRAPRESVSANVLVARHLEALYDNATALRAFEQVRAHMPQARLTIAGDGPQARMLRDLARTLKIEDAVCFTGAVDRDAMAALYRNADLILNPSLADNMPNSLLESMASGVPLVSTRVGGVPFLGRDGETGLLVAAGDDAAMAAAALRVLREPGLWQQLADAAFAEVQRYAWPHVRLHLGRVYQDAIVHRIRAA